MGESNASDGADDDTVGGRYRLLRLLGDGGAARVWLAHDDLLDRDVAVREVDTPPDTPSGQALAMQLDTMREARAAADLDHPDIVAVLDVVWSPGRSWIVMEYVEARSLHDIVHHGGPLDHREAARIGSHVLDALRAAHGAGILHRDVTPHNVLVGEDGRVALGNFGLAAFEGAEDDRAQQVPGSPLFLAPELLHSGGSGGSGASADLWSLGATLYATVEGRAPFVRATVGESVAARLTQPPDPVERPGPLHPVIAGMLVRNPAARMTADRVETELHRVAERAVGVFTVRSRPASFPELPAADVPSPGLPPADPPAADPPNADPPPAEAPSTSRADTPLADIPLAETPLAETPLAETPPVGATRARGRARGTRIAVGAAAVVLAAVAATTLAPHARRDGATPAVTPSTVPVAVTDTACAASRNAATRVSSATTDPRYELPAGWLWHADPAGFRIAVPQGWSRFTDGATVCFRDPDGTRTFEVDTGTRVTLQPLAYWRSRERTAIADGVLPGYRKVAMGVVMLRAGGAAWEYTITPDDRARQHVRRLLLNVDQKRAYVLSWITSDQDWAVNEAYQQLMVASFS